VAIGASAGGPAAVAELLAGLPRTFPGALVIVQHIDAAFTEGLATWLARDTPLSVRLARDGDSLTAGEALVAAGPEHLVLDGTGRLRYRAEPRHGPYHPSVDVFFHSVAKHARADVAGVLLTGMGRDGAAGLQALRHAGALTIAQDRATSAIYGMPKAAVALDPRHTTLPLSEIAPFLTEALTSRQRTLRSPRHG
jgi:chemotaxis response regulator CheB